MSSLFSHPSEVPSQISAYCSSNRYSYNQHKEHHYQQISRSTSPRRTITSKPLAIRNTPRSDVIAAKTSFCMSFTSAQDQGLLSSDQIWPPSHDCNSLTRHEQAQPVTSAASWSMQSSWGNSNSMGYMGISPVDGVKRQNSHQRASSTSTIASNGPASPYSFPSTNPHIANTDVPPFDHTVVDFAKDPYHTQQGLTDPAYLSANYLPVQALTKGIGSHRFHDYTQDFSVAAHSMSNQDSVSPSTPSSVSDESDVRRNRSRLGNGGHNLERTSHQDNNLHLTDHENRALQHPQVQLSRTESAAYQDELYNPANFTSVPASAAKPARPPRAQTARGTLVNQCLESANMARSVSPNSAVSRERSPFREGAELAPQETWSSPQNPIQTAASRRQQMKLEREKAELAAHRPQLQREPTKTISPKDALLDYNEPDQAPLIQDVVPAGYKQHFGGSEPYTNASATDLKSSSFALPDLSSQSKNMAGFRAASGDAFATTNFNFSPPASQTSNTLQNQFQMGAYQQLGSFDHPAYTAVSLPEHTPQFPATLTSMESSISEGPPISSQESNMTGIARPADTRANAGTYTCTYHGCAQRFESPALLQKHKKELHRSQQQQQARESLSAEPSSDSPHSEASPGPAGSGLTSAQILARNSQAGPHKCTRTNPSTGKPCNTVFSRPYDLTRHEDTIHNGRKHKVRCPYCREEKTFSRNDALTRHMRVVHPDVENFGKRGRRGD